MINDGINVRLSDELKTKLYMTADEMRGGFDMETGQKDPTYGMTPAQRRRYEKRLTAKPRPRQIFDVEALLRRRDEIIDRRNKKFEDEKLKSKKPQEEIKPKINYFNAVFAS